MNMSNVYTYRGGRKVELEKRADQFVVRALPESLKALGVSDAEQVSSASSRVTTRVPDLEPLMVRARGVAPTHHAYYVAESGEEFLITDRVLVRFKKPCRAEKLDTFTGRYGLVKLAAYSDREYLFQLTDHTGMNPVKLVVALTESEPDVEIVEHDLNRRAKTCQPTLPGDPSYASQWHLHTRLSDSQFDPRASSRCEDAWQLLGSFGNVDVVVGVTDDGCKLSHPDFDSPGKFTAWGYFQGTRLVKNSDIDAEPANMYQSGSNHGTSCAGVIAAETDSVLTVGAAPGCRLLPIKWESDGPSLFISDSKLMSVLAWIGDKVDVLSNSWGGAPSSIWSVNVTDRIAELAQRGGRRRRGIVFLWAAGNENCPIQHKASIDVPYDDGVRLRSDNTLEWVGVSVSRVFENNLTGIPGVAHVAALASTSQRSHYSNYGTGITFCAPTSNSHEYHRLTVRGLGITTSTGRDAGVTSSFGGTSSATPLVAGIAALVISANPSLTALEVLSLLKRTASKDLNLEGYLKTPPAVFDPNPIWDVSPILPFHKGDFADTGDPDGTWSPWFGHGRVDAHAAVSEAQQRRRGSSNTISLNSSPGKEIPDNDPSGVRDVIHLTTSGVAQDVRVSVEIRHTWIGDLRISLIAPDRTVVLLHDRSGSSEDNIQRMYTAAEVPALAVLRSRSPKGDWVLQVEDLAAQDNGVLQRWGLQIDLSPEPAVVEDSESVRIPDNDAAGVVRALEVNSGALIDDLAVFVDITHPWIGDLVVTLTPPSGAPIRLHDRAGRDSDNIVRTWRSEDTLALQALRGQSAKGSWQLQVADVASRDEGKLNRWRVQVVERVTSSHLEEEARGRTASVTQPKKKLRKARSL